MKNKQAIFIAVDQGFSSRYLLQTDIFKTLKESGRRIVILTPNAEENYFAKEFSAENVVVEKLDFDAYMNFQKKFAKLQNFMRNLRWYVMNGRMDLHTVNIRYTIYKKNRPNDSLLYKCYNLTFDSLVFVLRKSKLLRKFLLALEMKLFIPAAHSELFKKYTPEKLLVSSIGYLGFDHYIMREAAKHGVKIISVILSWDNTSTKGMPGAQADCHIAWTENMKKELVGYFDIRPDKIFIGGIAHFDAHFKKKEDWTRQKLFEHFGLDPDRKLIFFAPKSPNKFPWNPAIVEFIATAVEKDKFVLPCQLLVRLHPLNFRVKNGDFRFKNDTERHMMLQKKYKHLIYDVPQVLSKLLPMDMPMDEMNKTSAILKNADILLCYFSTMMLEATIFDLPVINIALYPHTDSLGLDDMQVLKMPHIKRILKTGGVHTVFAENELINAINFYLENRSHNAARRKLILDTECGPNTGKAGRSVGRIIVDC